MSTLRRRLMMAGKKSPIPPEYQLVEWIESNGQQYIETNIQATQYLTTHIELDLLQMPDPGGIFNDRNSYVGYGMSFYAGGYSVPAGGSYDRTGLGFGIGSYDIYYNINQELHNVKVNGIIYGNTSIAEQLYTIKLFFRHTRISCKFKHCEFIDMQTGNVIADLYPVYLKSNSANNGAYDVIGKRYLQGNVPFQNGPDATWQG